MSAPESLSVKVAGLECGSHFNWNDIFQKLYNTDGKTVFYSIEIEAWLFLTFLRMFTQSIKFHTFNVHMLKGADV